MKAIVSVIGKDKQGIIYEVTNALYQEKINVEDISQTIMQDYFTMIMMVKLSDNCDMSQLNLKLEKLSEKLGVQIRIQHEAIFNCMHKI